MGYKPTEVQLMHSVLNSYHVDNEEISIKCLKMTIKILRVKNFGLNFKQQNFTIQYMSPDFPVQ